VLTIFIALLRGATQPSDIFHDPNVIGLMGIGVGIAAIIAAVLVGVDQVRQGSIRRMLEYHLLSNGPIVAINSIVANQVEIDIRVKGVLVRDAHLIVLLIKNSGKVSIHAVDYFEPLTFEFDTQVLSASILEATPPTLINSKHISAFLTLTPQSVQFPALPLNPNDAVQINVLLEGKGTMKVRGRLGQGSIVPFESEKGNEKSAWEVFIVGGIVLTVVTSGLAYSLAASGAEALALTLTTSGSAAIIVLTKSVIMKSFRKRR